MQMKRSARGQAVEPVRLTAMLSLPVVVVGGMFVLRIVSTEVADVLTVWTLASFPIGMLVGHCVLREK